MRPEGVRLVNIATGEAIPCELKYIGPNEEGVEMWEIATVFDPRTERLEVDVFPAMTGITGPIA